MGDLLPFAYPEMLKVSFPKMFKDMSMATVQVNLQRVKNNPMNNIYGKVAVLIRDEHRHSVSFRVGSMLFTCTDGTMSQSCSASTASLKLARSVVAVPSGWVLSIEVDLHIKIPHNKKVIVKDLKVTLEFHKGTDPCQRRCPKHSGMEIEVKVTWEDKQCFPPPQFSRPVEVVKRMTGHPTVVYTIGDDVMWFTEFIMALRRILTDHPDREDILDGHDLLNLNSTWEHPLLAEEHTQPARWLHVKLQVVEGRETWSITLVMRDDSLYVLGFFNQNGVLCKLVDNDKMISLLPGGYHHRNENLNWGVTYPSLLGLKLRTARKYEAIARELRGARLGKTFAGHAVRMLSCYDPAEASAHGAGLHLDHDRKLALAGLIVMVCESARMNSIHNSIVDGWNNGTDFTREMVEHHLWNYKNMSEDLQTWKSGDYAEQLDSKWKTSGSSPQGNKTHPILQLNAIYLVHRHGRKNNGRNTPPPPPPSNTNKHPPPPANPPPPVSATGNNPPPPATGNNPPPPAGHTHSSVISKSSEAGSSSGSRGADDPSSQHRGGGSAGAGGDNASQHRETDSDGAHDTSSRHGETSGTGGPSQPSEGPSQQHEEVAGTQRRGHGRPRVEVLAVHANPAFIGMSIIIFDGKRGQIIYRKEEQRGEDKEKKGQIREHEEEHREHKDEKGLGELEEQGEMKEAEQGQVGLKEAEQGQVGLKEAEQGQVGLEEEQKQVAMKEEERRQLGLKEEHGQQETMVELVLTGPYTGVSAYGGFTIKIDIPDYGNVVGPTEWEWDCYKPEYASQVDGPPETKKIGNIVNVTYAVMSNALEATVQVKLRPKEGRVHDGSVCGKITAFIGAFPKEKGSVLFNCTEEGVVELINGSWLILLARSMVAVPYGSELRIVANLQIKTDNNPRGRNLNVTLHFANGTLRQSQQVDGDEVEVNITWYPEMTPEVVYTIGDAMSFTAFIMDLRRVLADHPDREDILDRHYDSNLSSTRQHPLLAKPPTDQPARWLHIKLQAYGSSVTLVVRNDDVSVFGFMNKNGVCYEPAASPGSRMLPPEYNSVPLDWGIGYNLILQAATKKLVVNKLRQAKLGKTFAEEAVRTLSKFKFKRNVDDDRIIRLALVGLNVMVCESAKMNFVQDAFARGWIDNKGFTKKLMFDYVWKYEQMSSDLREWKRRGYAEPYPFSELRDVYLVLNR